MSQNPSQQNNGNRRQEEEKVRRRRRDDIGPGRGRNLAVTGRLDERYTYRWVNDEPGRMFSLTERDDWERVTASMLGENHPKDKGVGDTVERIVDRQTGKRSILLRKLKDYYVEDKAKEQALIDDTEAAIKRGNTPTGGAAGGEALAGPNAYVPTTGITITPGGRTYTP